MIRLDTVVLRFKSIQREFDIAHAERLLRMNNNGGWYLPDNSNFEFNKKNGLTIKRDNEHTSKPSKRTGR